jgi:hypothetical protein
MVFGTCCLDLALIVIFLDETFYNREIPMEAQPGRGNHFMRILGVWQIQNHSYFRPVGRSYLRLFKTFFKPIIPLTMLYYMMSFMCVPRISPLSPSKTNPSTLKKQKMPH